MIKESQEGLKRLKYRFQYRREGSFVFRYDNAPHHKVESFPHHVHKGDKVFPSKEKNLLEVIKEIEDIL